MIGFGSAGTAAISSSGKKPPTFVRPKMDTDLDVLHMVHDSVEAGGRGVSIGRNVFQNGDVSGIARAISKIVLEDYSVEEAAAYLR